MPHNLQHEAIVKFLIPDQPQQDNYLDPDEYEEKEKEWMEQQDLALAWCTAWVEKEQVVEAKCAVEATHAEAEKQKLQCEAAEHKQMAAAWKKVGTITIVEVLASRTLVCARCSLKGLSSYFLSVVG